MHIMHNAYDAQIKYFMFVLTGESTTSTEQVTFLEEDAAFNFKSNDKLAAGVYRYVFKFKLPLNIPGENM